MAKYRFQLREVHIGVAELDMTDDEFREALDLEDDDTPAAYIARVTDTDGAVYLSIVPNAIYECAEFNDVEVSAVTYIEEIAEGGKPETRTVDDFLAN